jgi:AcrR family transcriptional regulator
MLLRVASVRRKPPRQYHHGDLRRAVVDLALKIVDEEGVEAVTIRALAKRLGVSHAAPGHHFPDRDALLASVATEVFRRFADALEAAARDEPDPAARLIAVGVAYVRFGAQHPSYLRLMFGHGSHGDRAPPDCMAAEAARAYAALTNAVRDVVGALPETPGLADELAYEAWSLVHGMVMLWIDGPARIVGDEQALCAMARRVLQRAVGGLSRREL